MSLQSFYEQTGNGYDEIKSRLGSDTLITKFLKMFPEDPSYAELEAGMKAQDWKAAFAAVHTLKGVTANLGIKNLFDLSCALTEDLRSGSPTPSTNDDYAKVQAEYQKTISLLASEV